MCSGIAQAIVHGRECGVITQNVVLWYDVNAFSSFHSNLDKH